MSDEARSIHQVIGDNLRRARTARGLTVRQLADRLAEIGTPMALSVLSESEHANRRVTVADAIAFALALNIPIVDLLTAEAGSIDLAPDVPPIPNHAVASWVSGTDPWPPEADREAFLQFADEHRRAVDATWNKSEMMAISALRALMREALTGTQVDPAKLAKALRREARRVVKYVDLLADSLEDDNGRR